MPRPILIIVLVGTLLAGGCQTAWWSSDSTEDGPWTRWLRRHPQIDAAFADTETTLLLVGGTVAIAAGVVAYLYLDGKMSDASTDPQDARTHPIAPPHH
jgi:hypothetical protein